jgi:hypothetical protein
MIEVIVKDPATRKKLGALAGGGSGRRFTAEFVTKKMLNVMQLVLRFGKIS